MFPTYRGYIICFDTFSLYFFHFRITQMQQQKENLTVQVNDTVAEQLALEEEAAGLKLALGNITSSLHQLALTDASPYPEADHTQFNQTKHLTNFTTEVSLIFTAISSIFCCILNQ